jgi:hypothetical protein
MERFQLIILCQNCKHGTHESCAKLHKQDFVTIKCNCTCHQEKVGATERVWFANSVATANKSLEGSKE